MENGTANLYSCEKCGGREFVYFHADDGELLVKPCECRKRSESIRRMRRSGLETVISELTFASYKATEKWQQDILAAAKRYADGFDGWFFIGGQVGSGKTHICTAICREALRQGKEVRYLSWRDEAQDIKRCVNDHTYIDRIEPLKRCDLLYIDDLFKGGERDGNKTRPTVADTNFSFDLLNFRYINKLPTVISCERFVDEIMEIDGGIGSRIYQMAKSNEIQVERKDDRNYRMVGR